MSTVEGRLIKLILTELIWGFPKIRDTFLFGIPVIRIILFVGVYVEVPLCGSYRIFLVCKNYWVGP